MTEWIASIEEKKQGKLLHMDDGNKIWISRGLLQECPFEIEEKKEIDVDLLTEWLMPRQYETALAYAVDLLARQDRSSDEIRKKLNARNYLPDTIEMVLYKLDKEHLIDDTQYAVNCANNLMHRNLGINRIRQTLKLKGLSEEVIDSAIAGLDYHEIEDAALSLARQLLIRYQNEENEYRKKEKVIAAMARRGYRYDTGCEAIAEAKKLLIDEESDK